MTTADRLRRTEQRLMAATAPSGRRVSRGSDLGDGPVCPGDASHGRTYLTRDRSRFICVHQSHDMTSRSSWPNSPES